MSCFTVDANLGAKAQDVRDSVGLLLPTRFGGQITALGGCAWVDPFVDGADGFFWFFFWVTAQLLKKGC